MAVNPSAFGPKPQLLLSTGLPAVGGLLFMYVAGSTSTKQNSYSDSTGGSANPNPIVLNSLGEPTNEIWWTSGASYKVVYAPAGDTDPPSSPIWTIDNLKGINDTTTTIDQWVLGPTPTFVNATSFTLIGDQTSTFQIGRRVKSINSGGTIYSSITNSVYGALTTVTVVNDSGTLDSGLSSVYYGLLSATNPSVPGILGPITQISGNTNFTGVPTLSATPSANDNSTKIATTAYADRAATTASLLQGHIYGLECAPAADTVHDITISVGQCINSTNANMITLAGAITKQIDASWAVGTNQGGMFTGSVANNTTYHFFIIRRSDTGVVDAGWDTSITAANKPANYDSYRRIMSVKTDGSAQILPFEQTGHGHERKIRYLTPILDINNVAQSTAYASTTLSLPTGLVLEAFGSLSKPSGTAGITRVRSPNYSDGTPSGTASPLGDNGVNSAVASMASEWRCNTNTSGQIQTAVNAGTPAIYLTTDGFTDYL